MRLSKTPSVIQSVPSRLRRKQLLGMQFYRQNPIAGYIVDFYCAESMLVVELDGDSHYQEGAQEYDHIRDECMRSMGLRILRFSNLDVMKNIDGVLLEICNEIKQTPCGHP